MGMVYMQEMIKAENITKIYKLYNKPIDILKEAIRIPRKSYHRDFYALNDVSFSVSKGESFGIIGVNGSGKSTLLKIVTGVLKATSGSVKTNGTIAALLELGAGFNMDYTGIENIYMNGTMMGFSRKEMDEKLDKILDFADIGDFVYRPVKQYSSGMFVRLAFALSIAVEPDILIVDEALSVGDIFFQAKCYKRMDELKKNGTTIVMVTHDLGAVMRYCDRAMVLNSGIKVAEGKPHDMIDLYKKILAGHDIEKELNEKSIIEDIVKNGLTEDKVESWKSQMNINKDANIYGDNTAEIIDFGIFDENKKLTSVIMKGEIFYIKEKIKINKKIINPIFTYTIKDKRGVELSGTNTMFEAVDTKIAEDGDIYEVEFKQKMNLQGGEYLISMSCTSYEENEFKVHHRMYDVLGINVISNKNTVGVYDMESEVKVVKSNNNI